MSSGFGAAAGADMLQEILTRKMREQIALRELANREKETDLQHSLGLRRADQTDRQISQGDEEFGFRKNQWTEQAPMRIAGLAHTTASTDALNRAPAEAEEARQFSAGEAEKGRTFTGEQGNLNRTFQGQEGALNRGNALAIANVRHPDGSGPAADAKAAAEQNDVQDSLALISEIRNDKALPTATGRLDGMGVGMLRDPDGYTRVAKHHETLVNRMQLAIAGKLKGQGPVSNFERDILRNAATSLDRTLGTPDYQKELDKVEVAFKRLLTGPRASSAPQGNAPAKGGGFRVLGEVK